MSASFYDLMKYARTGIASPSMTYYDKQKALAMCKSGFPISTITGATPLSFRANGKPLISWTMKGNAQRTGTPTPDTPIDPDFCGKLVGTDWTIPITCAGQTVPVNLGEVQTVRRIKKRVFDGSESWTVWNYQTAILFYTAVLDGTGDQVMSSHFGTRKTGSLPIAGNVAYNGSSNKNLIFRMLDDTTITTVEGFKAWLAAQYAAETPVTVWYVLNEPETGIVNEPLAKIGDYADELHSEDAGATIPTVKGQNTLTVDTELQPSSVSLTGGIK